MLTAVAAPAGCNPVGTISSARLTLRPVAESDLDDLMQVNGDPAVTRFLPYDTWTSLDDGVSWLRRMQTLASSGTGQQLVIVRNDDRTILGTALIFRLEASAARAEIGYVLGRRHWGQGIMYEALSALLAHAFGAMALRRIEAEVNPDNVASNGLLQRLDFTLEGTLRERWLAKGIAYDTNFYGLLAQDWRTRHRRARDRAPQ